MEDETRMSFGDRFEELMEIDILKCIVTGLSVAATIAFGLMTLVLFFYSIFFNFAWYTVLVFILCGLITGAAWGISYFFIDEYV